MWTDFNNSASVHNNFQMNCKLILDNVLAVHADSALLHRAFFNCLTGGAFAPPVGKIAPPVLQTCPPKIFLMYHLII